MVTVTNVYRLQISFKHIQNCTYISTVNLKSESFFAIECIHFCHGYNTWYLSWNTYNVHAPYIYTTASMDYAKSVRFCGRSRCGNWLISIRNYTINSCAKSAWYACRQHSYNICKDFLSHNSWMKNLNSTNSCTINMNWNIYTIFMLK